MENNQTTRTMAMEDLHLIRQVLDQTATSFQTLAPVFWRMGLVWLLYGVLAFFVNTSDFIGYYFPPCLLYTSCESLRNSSQRTTPPAGCWRKRDSSWRGSCGRTQSRTDGCWI